jgi:hypothetical protein
MLKVDFKEKHKELYRQSDKKVEHVVVPEFNYLAIDGERHPEQNKSFEEKIGAIYGVAYALKFMLKKPALQPEGYFDFVMPPLECFWFMKDGIQFDPENFEDWRWTLMVMQADYITEKLVNLAKKELLKKGKAGKYLDGLRLEKNADGKAVQLLHLGPYNEVGDTITKLKEELSEKGMVPRGKYREIYLNDPRRVSPEKIKTICRMPYK